MTPKQSARLIDSVGGSRAFAERLGLPSNDGYLQRLHNWKKRGIPAQVLLDHYDLINELKAASKSKAGA